MINEQIQDALNHPNLIHSVDPDTSPIGVISDYSYPEKVRCSFCRTDKKHNKGFLFDFGSAGVAMAGEQCATKIYSNIQSEINRYKSTEELKTLRSLILESQAEFSSDLLPPFNQKSFGLYSSTQSLIRLLRLRFRDVTRCELRNRLTTDGKPILPSSEELERMRIKEQALHFKGGNLFTELIPNSEALSDFKKEFLKLDVRDLPIKQVRKIRKKELKFREDVRQFNALVQILSSFCDPINWSRFQNWFDFEAREPLLTEDRNAKHYSISGKIVGELNSIMRHLNQ